MKYFIIFLVLMQVFNGLALPAKKPSNLKKLLEIIALRSNDNPEELAFMSEDNIFNSNLFEEDIFLDGSTSDIFNQLLSPSREALVNPVSRWPNGRIPYVFGPVTTLVKNTFHAAVKEYEKHTCIKIVPRTSERDYLYIVSEGGCWSSIGRSGYRQKLSIGRNCERKGIVMHELMHTLGFFHEQSRLDRDDFVTIHWENIDPKRRYNFQKYEHGKADSLGFDYDYESIMHYPMYSFTSNGRATIVPKDPKAKIGQRKKFSEIDIAQLNKFYNCPKKTAALPTTPAPTTTPAPPTKPTEPCLDTLSTCWYYAWFGYCDYYFEFMTTNCRKSCYRC
ncbi:zinc metalloproteinase nas-15-like [Actinia tenebrosa]|uniref:Metalloendopeptidase n=1 Tax=Actinia tenebrosa TaxID=6105 RepID=A0A6P8HYG7_ACTTE|nr:zinc metalloproteinase nas-15-like [Actinia tenebrosa]XP_031560438.1 zinc metalloproteinase nas-15-like [Actinia tenebrosa]